MVWSLSHLESAMKGGTPESNVIPQGASTICINLKSDHQ